MLGIKKTNVLAIALWEAVNDKRWNLGYKEERDNYTIIFDPTTRIVILQSWDDSDITYIRADTPRATGNIPVIGMPPGFYQMQSATSMVFHFLGALVSPQKWTDTKATRLSMGQRDRDV